MALASDLERVLSHILPMPAMMAQGRLLGMPNHMEMIRDRLWAINGTIKDAEHRALKEPESEEWVTDVGAAIVDIDDLLGRILDWHPRGGAAAASNRSSHSICSIREASRQAILLELKEMVGRLNYLVRRGSVLGLSKEIMESVDPRQEEEYSTVLKEEVVGRNEHVEEIIDSLKQPQSGDCDELQIINDLGGKTTLARLIYHHPWVQEQFQHRIWVDVPNIASLDPMWIMREFTSSITGEPCEDIWLFFDGIHGSKYLLVLDDLNIGEEDRDKWLQLENFLLLVGAPGSTVVVIPDLFFIQDVLGSAVRTWHFSGLPEDDWVQLCLRQALIRPDQREEAKAIIHSCKRNTQDWSPTDAKIFGSVLRYTEMSRWQQQLDAVNMRQWEKVRHDKDMALIFLHYMTPTMTRLVLYRWLIVQDGKTNYEVLAAEGFLSYSDVEGTITEKLEFHVYDYMHFLFTTTKHCYDMRGVLSNSTIPRQCLYLRMFVDSNSITFPMTLFDGINQLRGLLLQQEMDLQHKYHILHIPEGMFTNLIHLRILYLRAIKVQQLPTSVGKLLILRYLNLSQSEIQALPKSLCKLRNLRVLNLAHCEKLQKLPKRIHNLVNLHVLKLAYCTKLQMLPISVTGLINLQELDLEGCQWLLELPEGLNNMKKLANLNVYRCPLNQMPHGISQMSNLLKLSGHIVVGDLGNAFSKLESLRNLKELWLQNLEQVLNSEDALTPLKLNDILPQLIYLKLCWKWINMEDMRTSEVVSLHVLEGLQPNSNLKRLEIILYVGEEFPVWIKEGFNYLHKLKEIKLINLKRCKKLPSLGGLLDLEIVELSGMDLINVVDEAFYGDDGTFPELKRLTLSHMLALEKWLKVDRKKEFLFPKLRRLTLIQCPKFKALEVDLEVSTLSIWLNNKMLRTSEFEGWQNLPIKNLEIVGCQEMRCLPQDMERCVKLRSLTINGCDNLDCLPEWLQGFKHLKSVCLYDCGALSSIPEKLKRLRKVVIKGCPKLRL
ncbi:putative disease resistance protein RGA1 [Musa acuminata AAA Group]|uniref:putative disease resistance protein RGA1 n=1 Tax=Musa acuminata AAA Group TaxID=214697 RepID=UPI0031E368B5